MEKIPVKQNNRKAPRMRKAKYSQHVITLDMWKEFREKYPEHKNRKDTELASLWEDIAETIREETATNPLGVKLGSYTGELKVQYLPYKLAVPNHVASEEVGYRVNQLSLASKGKCVKIKWERRWAVKFNRVLQFYAFESTRAINRLVHKHLSEVPESLRIARNTLGGYSIWRQLKSKYDK